MSIHLERARKLCSEMTLKEKIGQLAQNFYGFQAYERGANGEIVLTDAFRNYVQTFGGIGMLYGFFRADPWSRKCYESGGITAAEREKAYNLLQRYVVENTRLGIPVLLEDEAPHGRQALDSVIYPVSFNVGCSFHPVLYRKQVEMIGREAKIGGVDVIYQSVLDIVRDPRWGRTEESFGEDPYLASRFAAEAVRGAHDGGAMLCAKHFAAQGAMVGGHNAAEVPIGERELREIHLPASEAVCRAGCDFMMITYNEIDGIPCNANGYLNKTVLRDEMGFDGVTRSDGCAVDFMAHHFMNDRVRAGAAALQSGVDCGFWDESFTLLDRAMEQGYITEETINQAVIRLLEKKFQCGIMDRPYLEENGQSETFIKSGEGQQIAYEMACESLVLLKNDKQTLPLTGQEKILLIGENLDSVYYLLGDYTPEQKDNLSVRACFESKGASYLEGWRFDRGITVSEDALLRAVSDADVILYGFGGSSVRDFKSKYNDAGTLKEAFVFMDCGEGRDLGNLELVPCQNKLIQKIHSMGKPIVALGIGGRPYLIEDICDNADAVVWCGYPGQEGARAIYDTLIGKKNNFGRLTVTFPGHVSHIPCAYNRKAHSAYLDTDGTPQFAFGYGLSYSEFAFSDMEVEEKTLAQIRNGESISVCFSVKNVSAVPGKAVPQLYIHRCGGTVTKRKMELCGFDKTALAPGETGKITMEIGFSQLREWSVHHQYEIFEMELEIMAGASSDNLPLRKRIHIK